MYRFPVQEEIRQQWADFCKRGPSFVPASHHRLCQIHFENSDFLQIGNNNRNIREYAVPTILVKGTSTQTRPVKIYELHETNNDDVQHQREVTRENEGIQQGDGRQVEDVQQHEHCDGKIIEEVQELNTGSKGRREEAQQHEQDDRRRLGEAQQHEQDDSRLREAQQHEQDYRRLREAQQHEQDDRRLREAQQHEQDDRRHGEAKQHEQDDRRRQGEAKQHEQDDRSRHREAKEYDQSDRRRLGEAKKHEQSNKRRRGEVRQPEQGRLEEILQHEQLTRRRQTEVQQGVKRKFDDDIDVVEHLRKKLKHEQQKTRRLTKQRNVLKSLLEESKQKQLMSNDALLALQGQFSESFLELIKNELDNKDKPSKGFRYSKELKRFALSLHFHSPDAYNFLKDNGIQLPEDRTLRNWRSGVECEAGYVAYNRHYIVVSNSELCNAIFLKTEKVI